MSHWTDDFLGIPFKDGGRTRDGADCLGLYALILHERARVTLPHYDESLQRDYRAALARIQSEILAGVRWSKVPGEPGRATVLYDCVHMTGHARTAEGKVIRAGVHVGCAIGGGQMIHAECSFGPRVVRLDDLAIRGRILGVYRPRFLETSP